VTQDDKALQDIAESIDATGLLIAAEMRTILTTLVQNDGFQRADVLAALIRGACDSALEALNGGGEERAVRELTRLAASTWLTLASLQLAQRGRATP
jgi:hypothetical protein